ncbi:MAG: metal-sensing transcriptional repressor [Anaerolineae bacterium]|jgi:DNA-binding FrmR family transcriptional regulator
MEIPEHSHRHAQTQAVVNRLSRIEGHVRSIKTMVVEERDCSDILIQIAAVRSAIDKVARVVLEDHLESCVFDIGVAPEDDEIWLGVKEALDAFF